MNLVCDVKYMLCQTYGYQHLVTLHNLEHVGLIRLQGNARHYATVRKTLKLVVEEVSEQVGQLIELCFFLMIV